MNKDFCAELIGQTIPELAETEPRLNPEGNPWNAVEELDRLLQAADGLKAGALTFPGMWHYAEIARRALAALQIGSHGNQPLSEASGSAQSEAQK